MTQRAAPAHAGRQARRTPAAAAWLLVAAATLAGGLGHPVVARAQDATLRVEAAFQPGSARAGEATVLAVGLLVPPGYKLYGLQRVVGPQPTRLEIGQAPEFDLSGPWHGPRPKEFFDKGFGRKLPAYKGKIELRRVVVVSGDARPGEVNVELEVRGQICSDRTCLLQRVKTPLRLQIEAGAASPARTAAPQLPGEALGGDAQATQVDEGVAAGLAGLPPGLGAEQGVLGFLLTAFLAGLLALLTPCVFPMIPLTVSFFSKASGERFGRALLLAATYALSIVLTFTVAGIVISVVFGATGVQRFAAHWIFNLLVAGVLVLFGLSLVGLFEIRMPSGLIQRSETLKARYSRGSGPSLASVFFMALTFTLVSFSCTVAFVGAVVVAAAQGRWFWPTLGMLAFSSAFALPFFLLALFPQAARRLQRGGGDWLPLAKVLLGFVELAAALKFLSNVDLVAGWGALSRTMALSVWVALFAGATLYALKAFRFPEDPPPDEPGARILTVPRLMLAVVVMAWTLYLGAGLIGGRPFGNWVDGWLPPSQRPGQMGAAADGEGGATTQWLHSLDEGQHEAKAKDRPLLLNFTGVTCTNCRYMEEGVLRRAEVVRELRRFVAVELYTDRGTPDDDRRREYQVKTFGTAALPFYALLTPEGREIATFPGSTNDGAEFLAFLRKAPRKPVASPGAAVAPDAGSAAGPGPPSTGPVASPPQGGALSDGTPSSPEDGPGANAPPPPFALPALLADRPVRPQAGAGRFLLLHHWASWCSPCRAELKGFFTRLAQEYAARGALLVTVAFDGGDADSEEEARRFARSIDLGRWPALLAPADAAQAGLPPTLTPTRFPMTLLIAPDGRVLFEHAGELTEAELRTALEEHLPAAAERPTPAP